MTRKQKTKKELLSEIEHLESQLQESREVLRAIHAGEVDTLIIPGAEGQQVFTLQNINHTYRLIIDEMNEGAALLSPEGFIFYSNSALGKLLKTPLEQVIGSPLQEFVEPQYQERCTRLLKQAGPGLQKTEAVLQVGDGSQVPVVLTVNRLTLDDEPTLCLIATDLTRHKRYQEKLSASEQLSRSILDQAAEAIIVCDKNGTILRANHAAIRLCEHQTYFQTFGHFCRLKVVSGHEQLIPQAIDPEGYFSLEGMLTGKKIQGVEALLTHLDGKKFHLLLSAGPLWGADKQILGYVITLTDITARKQAEEALRQNEARLRAMWENTADAMVLSDPAGTVIDANPAYLELYGYSVEEIIGQNFAVIFPPEQRQWANEQYQQIFNSPSPPPTYDAPVRRSNGEERVVESRIEFLAQDGKRTAMLSTIRDITKRKQTEEHLRQSKHRLEKALEELKATQQRMIQQERLAAVGQLAAGIAHDFNNILTSIIGFADLLQLEPNLSQTGRTDLVRIVKQGQRGAHLVRQILDFARKTISQPRPIDLVPFIREAVNFLQRTIPENIPITLEIEAEELNINSDPTQLQQMLTNLALNARDAMPTGGQLRLRLVHLSLEPGHSPPRPDLTPGEWAALSVSDTGTGIAPEVLPRIFEPFFTTRETGQGTGLGLAQVHGIVKQHQGHIHVTSRPQQGTTFTIYLPLHPVEQLPPEEQKGEIIPGDNQTVLLVEDETEVLHTHKTMLESLGYHTLTAQSGEEALQIYRARAAEIDLVLTDVVMPGLDGIHLFQALKQENPHIAVAIITGYPLLETEEETLFQQGLAHWAQKPLTLAQLAHVVTQALQAE